MSDALAGDAAFTASAALAEVLAARGLAGVCIAPGSRSTPLVLAFARSSVPNAIVLDERSAAFKALGLAKATGRPAAVVTTSGTAVANLLPAVVEAWHARFPLLVLTADRPARLRDSGANQTIDQRGIFGRHAVYLEASDDLAARALEAFDEAVRAPAGPVHLNIAFDEPLVPSTFTAPEPRATPAWDPPPDAPVEVARIVPWIDGARGAIVAGPGPRAPEVADLAASLGWPLLAEPASGLRGLTAGEALVAASDRAADVVLQVGTTPTTRAMQRFVARARHLIVVDPDGRRQDPERRADATVAAGAVAVVRALASCAPAPGGWLREWERADAAARAALDRVLDDGDEANEVRTARDLAAALRPGDALLVGNSGPVRDLALGMAPRADIDVLANRGASGIDGLVSTAAGIAWSGRRTTALIGDLSLLHDLGALAWEAARGTSLTLVVIANGGGGIFDRLPTATLPEHERFFVTPHGADLGALARAAGASHTRVERASGLAGALSDGAAGVRVIEVVCARDSDVRERIARAVRDALTG